MKIETINDLEKWMIQNEYYKHSYQIGTYFYITEGYGLDDNGGFFNWYYTEKGKRDTIKYFLNEKDAVEFAFEIIKSDKRAKINK